MKKPKVAIKRVTSRIREDLLEEVKKVAAKKRWSMNTFIEEALYSAVGMDL